MSRQPDNWERMELERLLGDAVDEEAGSPGLAAALLAAFLGTLGYLLVTNGARAIEIAERVLYAGR